jgi:hypothetical protein
LGKPLVNFKTPHTAQVTFTGAADAVAALQGGTAVPTALGAADFNGDGAMDVVAGYSTGSSGKSGGVLALYKGNPDAFAPRDQTLYQKAAQGNVPPTFLSKAFTFSLPESPDLLLTADFNGDGKKDVLVAARGSSNLYLLVGDGAGNLRIPQAVPVQGQVQALAATADGHLAVSLDGPGGSQLAILDASKQGFTARATYPLPARGDSVAWGLLGGGLDLAVGAGSHIVMIYSALTANPQTETVTVPFQVKALVLGNFIWDRDGSTEISVLAGDGSIQILQHGTLNTAPLTRAEIPGRRAAIMAQRRQPAPAPNPTALGPWSVARQLPYSGPAPSGAVSASAFSSPRLASSSTHDLMAIDGQRSQLHILDTSGKTASPSADISFSGTPVAALALPQTIDSGRDLVVLTSAQAAPMLVHGSANFTLNVNTTADNDDVNACTDSSVTSIPNPLTLREAVCIANNIAVTATINVPAGTYDLAFDANAGTGELKQGTGGSYRLSIIGTGTAANTTIAQTDNTDRILEGDDALEGDNPITIENLTLTNGNCTTGTDCEYGGGAVLTGGGAGDEFVATNLVVTNNSTTDSGDVDYGGGLNNAGSDFTITNCTISGNTAGTGGGGAGGGAYYTDYPPTVEGVVTITNSSFTNNTSVLNGGGINAMLDSGYPMTVTGSTFTGNQVTYSGRNGGGIFAGQTNLTATSVTVSNSRIVGNSAPAGATGVAVEDETIANLENNWWGCNAGPGGAGCDTAYIETSGSYSPVLTLSVGALSTQVAINGSTTLNATINDGRTCSGYAGNACYVPDGTAATFSGGSLGSADPASTTFASGVASSTFTAGSSTGSATASVTVDNQTETVGIEIGQPPTITSASSTTFTVGSNTPFSVTTNGTPVPSLNQSGRVPTGVSFQDNGNGTGTLGGTPAAGTGGVYNISFGAQNGYLPNASQNFILTVNQAPSITSGNSTTFAYNSYSSITVTATGYPSPTFTESGGLPTGVNLSSSGVLSGTPTQSGVFTFTIYADNGVGTQASQSFTLTVNQAPSIASVNNATFTENSSGTFPISATGYPSPTITESGTLPTGLNFNGGTGSASISGTPTQSGVFNVTLYANNGIGTQAMQSFTLTVNQAASITSANGATFTENSSGTFPISATGYPSPTITESGTLPTGLNFNGGTGSASISGTPSQSGVFNVTLYANNGVGTQASQNFTLTVNSAGPPTVMSLSPTSGTGLSQTFTAVYSDPNGVADLSGVGMIFSTGASVASGCALIYVPGSNTIYLYNNAGTALLSTGVIPGSSGSVSNNQCTVNGTGSSTSTNGNNLTVNFALSFSGAFLGQKNVSLNAAGQTASSGFLVKGTWLPSSAGPPTVVSLLPTSGSGATETFTAVYSDPNGVPDLTGVGMIFNTSLSAASACAVIYAPNTNLMYLYDNAGTALLPTGVTPGSAGSVSNSQCTVNGTGSSFSVTGNDLTLNVALTFSGMFVGKQDVILNAAGKTAASSFVAKGTWTP